MPKHKLYQMMLNCEDWRSSSTVGEMPAAMRGIYIDLLTAAWLTEDCTLPTSENALRRLGRPDSEAQWAVIWPELQKLFVEEGGRLHNIRQMTEFNRAKGIYKQRCDASELAVEAKRRKREEEKNQAVDRPVVPSGSPAEAPHKEPTYNPQLTEQRGEPTDHKSNGSSSRVAEIIADGNPVFDSIGEGVRYLKSLIGETVWLEDYWLWMWMHETYPGIIEDLSRVRGGDNPAIRSSKGWTKIKTPPAYIRSRCNIWMKETGIKMPKRGELKKTYEQFK